MGDVGRLESLVKKLTEANVKLTEDLRAANVDRKNEIDRVVAALGGAGGAGGGGHVGAAAVRAKNVANLKLSFRKSSKVKDYKENQELKIQEWIKRFEEEAVQLKLMNGINDDLTLPEYISCFKDKLDYAVLKRLEAVFANTDPPITWADVTKKKLHDNMIAEFGKRESDVSAILIQFGPNRFKKN